MAGTPEPDVGPGGPAVSPASGQPRAEVVYAEASPWPRTTEQPGNEPLPGGNGGGWGPPPGWWPPPPPRRTPGAALRVVLALVLAVVAVIGGIAIGYAVWGGSSPTSSSAPGGSGGSGTSPGVVPGGGGSGTSSGPANAAAIAAAVDPALVDVNTTLGYQGAQAAGTGMVLTASGRVLTNNHVINGATSVSVTDVGNGRTYKAEVVGYSWTSDVAVLQLQGASGLATVPLGDSSSAKVNDPVVALGNAGGVGGTPSVATGSITALNQSITASDQSTGASERLSGLIETDAPIRPGDSGGPLVNAAGKVIGMNTAASSQFSFNAGATQGYSIPINSALTLAHQIVSGQSSDTVHIGPTAFLGVEIRPQSSTFGGSSGSVAGALVVGVTAGGPASGAGLSAGDVITSVGGTTVTSDSSLTNVLRRYHPGDTVQVGWTDPSGQSHTASVSLVTGPAG